MWNNLNTLPADYEEVWALPADNDEIVRVVYNGTEFIEKGTNQIVVVTHWANN
jgi:hypothetical protein